MTIRNLADGDIEAARAFWQAVPGLSLGASDEPDALSRFFRRNPGLSWAAFDGQTLSATLLAGHDGRRGFLYHLAVSPKYRGQGLSAELMRRALDGLSAAGVDKVHAFVLADNLQGLSFWANAARHGWNKRGDILIFSKSLSLC